MAGGADYGIDAPGAVANLAAFGGAGLLLGTGALFLPLGGFGVLVAATALCIGVTLAVPAALMVLSSRSGKARFRDALLDGLGLVGDEHVLDAGCGKGLLLVGAAHRLPRGLAVGIDVWSPRDQSGNRAAAPQRNARLEGVAPRVAVVTADMRTLPLHHASFDVAVSNLALHTIATAAGRADAVRELARVVRPGGTVAIADRRWTAEHAGTLRGLGWTEVRRGPLSLLQFPPVRTVRATRPGSAPARRKPGKRQGKGA